MLSIAEYLVEGKSSKEALARISILSKDNVMGPTIAEISHKNLNHNLQLIRNRVAPAKVMAVVKADAYGHGIVEVAQTMLKGGAEYLGVAFHEEGVRLRESGINAPILVFGAQLEKFFEAHINYNLDITLSRKEQIHHLKEVSRKLNKSARVHIKFDTGMSRIGFVLNENLDFIFKLFADPQINVVGIYSHLSSADETDLSYTLQQVQKFNRLRETICAGTDKPLLFHLANSAAIMRLPEARFDMVRPGVMLYGNPPSAEFKLDWNLKEGMRFISRVAAIKTLPAQYPVSYNRRFQTSQKTKLAVIPAGYADGYNRKMTNIGQVLIRGKRFPVAGTVCMDQFIAHLGNNSSVEVGDEVVLFGRQNAEHISITEVSAKLNTIPYEVTCWVSSRVPRIHLFE